MEPMHELRTQAGRLFCSRPDQPLLGYSNEAVLRDERGHDGEKWATNREGRIPPYGSFATGPYVAGQGGGDVHALRHDATRSRLPRCRPATSLAHEDAHIQSSEAGAPGAISGVMIAACPVSVGSSLPKRSKPRSALSADACLRGVWLRSADRQQSGSTAENYRAELSRI
jgi:hypothetical protein